MQPRMLPIIHTTRWHTAIDIYEKIHPVDDAIQTAPASAPTTGRTDVNIDVDCVYNGQRVQIKLHVDGEGEVAQRAATELSQTVAGLIGRAVGPTPVAESASLAMVDATEPSLRQKTAALPSPTQLWFRQHREHINKVVGGTLLALAVIVPVIVPVKQRGDVLVMTILFALTGALLLFTAFLPGRAQPAAVPSAELQPSATPKTRNATLPTARRSELLKPMKQPVGAGWGLALGALFVVAGLLAPFALGAASADERFVIMLGFAPVTVVGFFMIAIFGRSYFQKLQAAKPHADAQTANQTSSISISVPSTSAATRRAPVGRVPQTFEYRTIVPAAIVALLALMAVVVILVIYATVSSAIR